MTPSIRFVPFLSLLLVLVTGVAHAQDGGGRLYDRTTFFGPTFTVSVLPSESGVTLEWQGHAALTPESRRIETLDLTVKYSGKDAEKYTKEGTSELLEGKLELEGKWKEIRFSYKIRTPGTINVGNPRVACRLDAKKITLPALVVFEAYQEGPRCTVTDSSTE